MTQSPPARPPHFVVLQRPGSSSPCERWLRDAVPNARVTVVSGTDTVRPDHDFPDDVNRILVADYESPDTTAQLLRLCRDDPPDRVLANSEDDILRAAEARTLFGVAGQKSGLASMFRDKVRMKELFTRAAIPVVRHQAAACAEEVLDAQREHGTIVLKPRGGAGSEGVHVLRTAEDVRELFVERPRLLARLHDGRLIAEPFVSGDVYHVDVLVDGDRVLLASPSRYLAPPHLFREAHVGSVMLDDDSAASRSLTAAAADFVSALPDGHGVSVLHIEFYEPEPGRFLAGEVACRVAGGQIKNSIQHTYGVDISQFACLLAAGLPVAARDLRRIRRQSGWISATGPAPLEAPAGEPPKWLVASGGSTRTGPATTSVDAGRWFLVHGADEAAVTKRLAGLSV